MIFWMAALMFAFISLFTGGTTSLALGLLFAIVGSVAESKKW